MGENNLKSELRQINEKLDKLDDKLTAHLERIAVVEEHSRGNRAIISVGYTIFLAILGLLFKVLYIG